MIGTSWIRRQDMEDPLLNRLLRERNLDDVPFFARRLPARETHMRRWKELALERDGTVTPSEGANRTPPERASDIKALARELGADMVGMVRLRPKFLEIDTKRTKIGSSPSPFTSVTTRFWAAPTRSMWRRSASTPTVPRSPPAWPAISAKISAMKPAPTTMAAPKFKGSRSCTRPALDNLASMAA